MPRGYPDWFGQPQFPKFGAVKNLSSSTLVPSGVWTDVFTINGKGKTYYGRVYYLAEPKPTTAYFELVIDGTTSWQNRLDLMRDRGAFPDPHQPFFLRCFDRFAQVYGIGIRGDITFEKSLTLRAYQASGNNIYCYYNVIYTLIE